MKTEKLSSVLAAMILALMLSIGGTGCLMTGFQLSLAEPELLWMVCGFSSLLCGFLFLWKWGAVAAGCLLAVWLGFLWRGDALGEQLLQLVHRISHTYDSAYGWGVIALTEGAWNAGTADLPLQLLGSVIAMTVCQCVLRGKRTWPAMAVSLIPLALCLVVTDTVPKETYLFLLLLGMLLLLLGASVRQQDALQAGRLTLMVLLPVALVLGLLFQAFPQKDYVNHSAEVREKILSWAEALPQKIQEVTQEITVPGQSDTTQTVNLKTLGSQTSLKYPVMEVTSDCGGAIYLRGQDYDGYDGFGWTATPHRSEEFTFAGEAAGTVEIATRSRWDTQFVPYYPEGPVMLVGGGLDNPENARRYILSRNVLPQNWRETVERRAQGDWESEHVFATVLEASNTLDAARYLTLPTETRLAAEKILNPLLRNKRSATEKADSIAAFVRRTAPYDRDTARMPSDAGDFALWFLEEAETGYCVHFATAAVVLLRAARVPARYVTGYLAHCRSGETVTVTADTAHAWAEYYEPQLACWIPLEATPSEGVPQDPQPDPTQAGAPTRETEQTLPPESTFPQSTKPQETQQQAMETLPEPPEQQASRSLFWLWPLIFLAAVLLQGRLRLSLRRRSWASDPNRQALSYWQEILLLAKLQKKRPPRELETLAQKAKFSQHTLTVEELAKMENYMDCSIADLKQQPWYMQLLNKIVFAAY